MLLVAGSQPVRTATSAQRRQLPAGGSQPTPGRRRLLSVAVPLLFLPWRGCDQGGNYSTGVGGVPGRDCQQIYQPAAAAEKRFAERQRQAAEAKSAAQQAQLAPPPSTAASSEREERQTLLKEQQVYEREAMRTEQGQRTQQLVDGMWQSLE